MVRVQRMCKAFQIQSRPLDFFYLKQKSPNFCWNLKNSKSWKVPRVYGANKKGTCPQIYTHSLQSVHTELDYFKKYKTNILRHRVHYSSHRHQTKSVVYDMKKSYINKEYIFKSRFYSLNSHWDPFKCLSLCYSFRQSYQLHSSHTQGNRTNF